MPDTWHKIIFPEDVTPLVVTTNIVTNQVLPTYADAGDPKGFAVYGEVKLMDTEPEKDYRYVLYFTPVASEYCKSIIESYGVSHASSLKQDNSEQCGQLPGSQAILSAGIG